MANIQDTFWKAVIKREMFMTLSREMRKIIYNRTKSGKGLSHDTGRRVPTEDSLKGLSKSYKEWRAGRAIYFRKNGKLIRLTKEQWPKISAPVLGKFGSEGRSNFTLSGQALESLKGEYKEGYAAVGVKAGRRRAIKRRDGSEVKGSNKYTNEDVINFQRLQGRFIMNLTAEERRIIRNSYEKMLVKSIKNAFK